MTDQPIDQPESTDKGSKRIPVIVGVSALVAGVLAAGAFAAGQILGAGAQPETVMPQNVIAFASVDIDPGAGQKIEAIRTLRKFPELRDAIKIGEKDDLRKRIFEEVIGDGDCKGRVDYDEDIEPWLGGKAAIAAVDHGEDAPTPLLAVKVGDEDAAAKGVDALRECESPRSESAYGFKDGFLLLSDSKAHLDQAMADADKANLADSSDFADWNEQAGGDGIVNFYVSKRATDLLARMAPDELGGADGDIDKSLENFEGMAGALRFADGGLELEIAAAGTQAYLGHDKLGAAITKLPRDTVLAVGVAVPANFAELVMSAFEDALGTQSGTLVAQAESQTGLSLPEDLQTLLGKAVVLALGGDAPDDLAATTGPADLPVGLKIIGDPNAIKAVIAKAEERSGQRLSDADLVQETDGSAYILASNADFAAKLEEEGDLGGDESFRQVIPRGGDSGFAVFVDFDSAWRDAILDLIRDQEGDDAADKADANTAPLEALGISGWVDDEVSHAVVKITTD